MPEDIHAKITTVETFDAGMRDVQTFPAALSQTERFSAVFREEALTTQVAGQENFSAGVDTIIRVSTDDYEKLSNKPSIEGVTLVGNKTADDLWPAGAVIYCGDSENVMNGG